MNPLPQPQANSTPAIAPIVPTLSGSVNNEDTLEATPMGSGRPPSNLGCLSSSSDSSLSVATSISLMLVENAMQITETESIEAQRRHMKVSAKIENILQNWRVERTLVPSLQ